jgi:hypothetical protein
MAKQKQNIPRHKRLKRAARLQAAKAWLLTYPGKNIAKGYRKHFAVDPLCAIAELQLLGVKLEANYIEAVKATLTHKHQKAKKLKERSAETFNYCDERFAYIAGYTSWGFAYGVTWEEMGEEPPDFDDIFEPTY